MAAPRGMQTPEPVSGEPGDDAAVIARSLDDPEQFAVVFRRHAPDIHRYVVRRLGVLLPHGHRDHPGRQDRLCGQRR